MPQAPDTAANVPFAESHPPPAGTVERWAWDYVLTTDLSHKLSPPPPPSTWETSPPPRRIRAPGRPAALVVSPHAAKTPGPEALRSPSRRAQLVHTFLHHELQAAELMAWALLAFADRPRAFRGGLVRIALDEVRHMGFYAEHLAALGHRFGDFPVRDWFWERVPSAPTAAHFVAVMGVGFEGANLDHTARFADRFRAAGDEAGARLQERVGEEEIPHVRFALRWLRRWTRDLPTSRAATGLTSPGAAADSASPADSAPRADSAPPADSAPRANSAPSADSAAPPDLAPAADMDFATWTRHLPPPLSPILMRGKPLNRESRRRAGLPEPFLDELVSWSERSPGS